MFDVMNVRFLVCLARQEALSYESIRKQTYCVVLTYALVKTISNDQFNFFTLNNLLIKSRKAFCKH